MRINVVRINIMRINVVRINVVRIKQCKNNILTALFDKVLTTAHPTTQHHSVRDLNPYDGADDNYCTVSIKATGIRIKNIGPIYKALFCLHNLLYFFNK